ncbi:MAG: redoxin domain-containing protein [Nitrospinae bacterium]|nr:redoxin domain-containing protein [Nitrospinota bacterium]
MGMRPLMSLIAGAFAFGLFSLAGGASSLETFRALPAPHQRPAPTFTLPDHQGTPIRSEDLQGKVVVMQFWVTW